MVLYASDRGHVLTVPSGGGGKLPEYGWGKSKAGTGESQWEFAV